MSSPPASSTARVVFRTRLLRLTPVIFFSHSCSFLAETPLRRSLTSVKALFSQTTSPFGSFIVAHFWPDSMLFSILSCAPPGTVCSVTKATDDVPLTTRKRHGLAPGAALLILRLHSSVLAFR